MRVRGRTAWVIGEKHSDSLESHRIALDCSNREKTSSLGEFQSTTIKNLRSDLLFVQNLVPQIANCMFFPVALCARNVSRQLVQFAACRSLLPLLMWTYFVTLCNVASCSSCSSHVQVALRFPLKTPASVKHSVSLQMVCDDMVCCPLVPRETKYRACFGSGGSRMSVGDLSLLDENVEGPDGGPLPGVDVSRTVQPNHSVVSRTSLFSALLWESLCTLAMFQQLQPPHGRTVFFCANIP